MVSYAANIFMFAQNGLTKYTRYISIFDLKVSLDSKVIHVFKRTKNHGKNYKK